MWAKLTAVRGQVSDVSILLPLGAWRSLVARTVRVGEVPGSNPGAPIASARRQDAELPDRGSGIRAAGAHRDHLQLVLPRPQLRRDEGRGARGERTLVQLALERGGRVGGGELELRARLSSFLGAFGDPRVWRGRFRACDREGPRCDRGVPRRVRRLDSEGVGAERQRTARRVAVPWAGAGAKARGTRVDRAPEADRTHRVVAAEGEGG